MKQTGRQSLRMRNLLALALCLVGAVCFLQPSSVLAREKDELHIFENDYQAMRGPGNKPIVTRKASDRHSLTLMCTDEGTVQIKAKGAETGLTGSANITCLPAVSCSADGDCPKATTPCYESYCDPAIGTCAERVLADGTVCEDGDFCTANEVCASGECLGELTPTVQCCPADQPYCASANLCLPISECYNCTSPNSCLAIETCPDGSQPSCPSAAGNTCPSDSSMTCCACAGGDPACTVKVYAKGARTLIYQRLNGVAYGQTKCTDEDSPANHETYDFKATGAISIVGQSTDVERVVVSCNSGVYGNGYVTAVGRISKQPSKNFAVFSCIQPPACFLAGSKVKLADGGEKPIEDLRVGDELQGLNPETEKAHTNKVVTVMPPKKESGYFELETASAVLHVTGEHPFYTGAGQYTKVTDLNVGSVLYRLSEGVLIEEKLEAKAWVEKEVTVYNVETDGFNNYVAEGILVHNKSFADCSKVGGKCTDSGSCGNVIEPISSSLLDPYRNFRCQQDQVCCLNCKQNVQCFDGDDCTNDLCDAPSGLCENTVDLQCRCPDGNPPDPVRGCQAQCPGSTSCHTKEECDSHNGDPNYVLDRFCTDAGFGEGYCCSWDESCQQESDCDDQNVCTDDECVMAPDVCRPGNNADGTVITCDGNHCKHQTVNGCQCGDGILHEREQCETDENGNATGCQDDEDCTGCQCVPKPVCGNGAAEAGEECGEEGLGSCTAPKVCTDCKCQNPPPLPNCGDGTVDQGEQCEMGVQPGCAAGTVCDQSCTCIPAGPDKCEFACKTSDECTASGGHDRGQKNCAEVLIANGPPWVGFGDPVTHTAELEQTVCCEPPVCGNGEVESPAEECEPGMGVPCLPNCKRASPQSVCDMNNSGTIAYVTNVGGCGTMTGSGGINGSQYGIPPDGNGYNQICCMPQGCSAANSNGSGNRYTCASLWWAADGILANPQEQGTCGWAPDSTYGGTGRGCIALYSQNFGH